MVHRTVEEVELSAEPLFRPHPLPLRRGQNLLTAAQCWWPQTHPQRPTTSTLALLLIPLTPPHSVRWFEETGVSIVMGGASGERGWVSTMNWLSVLSFNAVVKCKYGCSVLPPSSPQTDNDNGQSFSCLSVFCRVLTLPTPRLHDPHSWSFRVQSCTWMGFMSLDPEWPLTFHLSNPLPPSSHYKSLVPFRGCVRNAAFMRSTVCLITELVYTVTVRDRWQHAAMVMMSSFAPTAHNQ